MRDSRPAGSVGKTGNSLSFEQELFEQRRAKLRQIESLGFAAYPHQFAFTHTLGEIAGAYTAKTAEELAADNPSVKVCGRLVSIRVHGKSVFSYLTLGGSRLQLYVLIDAVPEQY